MKNCQIFTLKGRKELLITLFYNIGVLYLELKKYDLALFYFKTSVKLTEKEVSYDEFVALASKYDRKIRI